MMKRKRKIVEEEKKDDEMNDKPEIFKINDQLHGFQILLHKP